MSIIARQSTARTVMVGPIMDASGVAVTDGVVADLKISKNGGAPAALNGSATLTHRNTGHYSLALTASDLDTVGQAQVVIDDTVNAMPKETLTVIEEAVYDALFAASAPGYGTAQTGDSFARLGPPAGASVSADVAAVKAETASLQSDTNDIQTRLPAALVGGRIDASVGAMAANVVTASAVAADAVAEIQNGLATQASVDVIDGNVDDIELLLASTDADAAAIKAKTDLLTFNVRNEVAANAESVNNVPLLGDGSATPWGPA